MRVDTISNFSIDGKRYVAIIVKEPDIDKRGLYHGGRLLHFDIDWVRQKTQVYEFTYKHGCPVGFSKVIKKWNEALESSECFKYCEDMF